MFDLISPDYSFDRFCAEMIGKDPMQVMEAASAEITYARRNHREKTNESNFRKGSKGRAYCDHLQTLICLFTGSAPDHPTSDFVETVRPLALHLLRRWEVLGLREIVSMTQASRPYGGLGDVADFLTVVISREQVEAGDIAATLGVLQRLVESPKTARDFAERVDIAFQGYDDVREELFEIPEVRSFVARLDEQFPYWLFFLSKHCRGLQCLLLCFLPPSLTEAARARIFPSRIGDHLTRRWFPAMNHICRYAAFSVQEVNALTDRVEAYITEGRLPPGA
ncbi:MAG: hypothetical protein IT165_06455 [Bryobacterales bacterium]|nr:hypothetical protein [Bryobacterales bacterium]